MALLQIENLNFSYPSDDSKTLKEISFTVEQGELLLICGKSGSGKTTLLRHFKPVLTPHGKTSGTVLFDGQPVGALSLKEQAAKIGYVMQNPDNQIVTDKVWHELAFGLESLGFGSDVIRLRVAEMASFFGIGDWFYSDVATLSGGQKQLLNLASIMVMQPEILILDEPTSQLDPIAATEFLDTIKKINRELGTTIIMTEHRLEEVFSLSDRVIVMETGVICADGTPREVGLQLQKVGSDMLFAMPSAMQLFYGLNGQGECPLTVRDGRRFLTSLQLSKDGTAGIEPTPVKNDKASKSDCAITIRDVWFRYEKQGDDILKDLSLSVKTGTFHAIVGGNGSGKTTALSVISAALTPYRGTVSLFGKESKKYSDKELFGGLLGVLPQNPEALFCKTKLREDFLDVLNGKGFSESELEERIRETARLTDTEQLLDCYPLDLSGGEQQRAALAKVLLLGPKLLLLDEPTKGFDGHFKVKFAALLQKLKDRGVTILMVSHDIEFCARYADACSLFFAGNIVSSGESKTFFAGNSFYTTAANRMARHLLTGAITNEEVIEQCRRMIREKGNSN